MKIAKVLTQCNDCEFCLKLQSPSDNYTRFYICNSVISEPFLLIRTSSEPFTEIEIPNNCPLEDYTQTLEKDED